MKIFLFPAEGGTLEIEFKQESDYDRFQGFSGIYYNSNPQGFQKCMKLLHEIPDNQYSVKINWPLTT